MAVINYLYLGFLISALLFLWNHTDFFVEYCKLFKLWNWFAIYDFEKYKEEGATGLSHNNPDIGYLDYLLIKHDSFFIRIIVCPICLGVWLNIFAALISQSFASFSINLWLSLFLYFIIKLVMKKSDA